MYGAIKVRSQCPLIGHHDRQTKPQQGDLLISDAYVKHQSSSNHRALHPNLSQDSSPPACGGILQTLPLLAGGLRGVGRHPHFVLGTSFSYEPFLIDVNDENFTDRLSSNSRYNCTKFRNIKKNEKKSLRFFVELNIYK